MAEADWNVRDTPGTRSFEYVQILRDSGKRHVTERMRVSATAKTIAFLKMRRTIWAAFESLQKATGQGHWLYRLIHPFFALAKRAHPGATGPMFQAKTTNPPLAIALMLSATIFIASSTAFAKTLGTGVLGAPMHPLQVSFGRFLFAGLALGGAALVLRLRFSRVHWRLHVGRTACGWLGVTLMFAAVALIPLADATAISFLNPMFAMVFAIPLLGERVGPVRWGAAALAFVGALILLRPGTGAFQPEALLALGAAVVLGLEVILIKRLSGREGALQILLINNLIGLCIAGIAVLAVFRWPNPAEWGAMAGVGVSMAAAQSCFLNAMARAEASFIAPFSYATLICAAMIDFVVFDVVPLPLSMLGAAVIISGGVLLVWREGRLSRRAG